MLDADLDGLDLGLLQSLAWVAADPLLRYEPGPPHEAFLRDPARFRLLRAPSQSGKTTVAAYDVITRCLGRHPHADSAPPLECRVVCHSFAQSLVIQAKIHELIPPTEVAPTVEYHPSRGYLHREIRFANGSRIIVVTASQDRLALASATLDLVWIDEPPPPEVYAECASRLVQTGGLLLMTLTPVGRPLGWLRALVEEQPPSLSETHYTLTTRDCPWMRQAQVDEAIAHCLPSERPQVIYGDWDGVTPDRLFDGWGPDRLSHTIPTDEVEVVLGMDHGERPGAEVCLLILRWRPAPSRVQVWEPRQQPGAPHAHVWDEYVSPGRTTVAQDALAITAMLQRHGLSLHDVDEAAGDVNSAGKLGHASVNRELDRAFADLAGPLRWTVDRPHKGRGVTLRGSRIVNTALLEGRLSVHPRCRVLIDSLAHWRGDDDDHKHAIDALIYSVPSLATEPPAPAIRVA